MATSLLEFPAYKVFLQQLHTAERIPPSNAQRYTIWNVTFTSEMQQKRVEVTSPLTCQIPVANIWIQATIRWIESDCMLADDGTGIALITGLLKLPHSAQHYRINDHVMILGYVLNAGPCFSAYETKIELPLNSSVVAKLKAFKVADISKNSSCRTGDYWKREVHAAQQDVIFSSKSY